MNRYKTGYIYAAKCNITNKYYIGQTIQNPKKRWYRHKYDALNFKDYKIFSSNPCGRKFYNAIRKYGYNNFTWFVVKELHNCTTQTLDMQEKFWISFYNSIDNGYNSKQGGTNGAHLKENIQKQYVSIINYTTGEIYECINDAEKETGISHSNIIAVCKGRRKSAGGYVFGYIDDNITPEEIKIKLQKANNSINNNKKKKILCITTNEIFESLHAQPYTDYRNLSNYLHGSNKTKYCGRHPQTNQPLIWKFI